MTDYVLSSVTSSADLAPPTNPDDRYNSVLIAVVADDKSGKVSDRQWKMLEVLHLQEQGGEAGRFRAYTSVDNDSRPCMFTTVRRAQA